jgi:anti-anti-sigma regulatory factor
MLYYTLRTLEGFGTEPEQRDDMLDLSKVDYLHSSGIALIIQSLIETGRGGESIQTFGLLSHFQKVFTTVDITRCMALRSHKKAASAAFDERTVCAKRWFVSPSRSCLAV